MIAADAILGTALVLLLLAVGILFVFDMSDQLQERIWYRIGGLALVVGTCCMVVWQVHERSAMTILR